MEHASVSTSEKPQLKQVRVTHGSTKNTLRWSLGIKNTRESRVIQRNEKQWSAAFTCVGIATEFRSTVDINRREKFDARLQLVPRNKTQIPPNKNERRPESHQRLANAQDSQARTLQ
jgi:hypothetical protein